MLPPAIRNAAQLLGLGATTRRSTDDDDNDDDDDEYDEYDSEEEDIFVWDVSDPFTTPDPAEERVRNLIQAEIAHMRRYESVGPLQSLSHVHDDDDDDSDSDSEDQGDADDEDEDEKPNTILLPRLLHTRPLCVITSPPSPTPSSADDEDSSDLAEAEEQERVRKAKRDAHRSRLKALAILGPEAASAIQTHCRSLL